MTWHKQVREGIARINAWKYPGLEIIAFDSREGVIGMYLHNEELPLSIEIKDLLGDSNSHGLTREVFDNLVDGIIEERKQTYGV